MIQQLKKHIQETNMAPSHDQTQLHSGMDLVNYPKNVSACKDVLKSKRSAKLHSISPGAKPTGLTKPQHRKMRGQIHSEKPSRKPSAEDLNSFTQITDLATRRRFELSRLINFSGQAAISVVRSRTENRIYAIKSFKRLDSGEFLLETEALVAMRYHDRIVRLHEIISVAPGRSYGPGLLLDYYPAGDLHSLLERSIDAKEQVPEAMLWHFLKQMSEALAFIHHGMAERSPDKRTIIHRDIKLSNWLLDKPRRGNGMPNLRLADFGLGFIAPAATFEQDLEKSPGSSWCGTYEYWPPEAVAFENGAGKIAKNTKAGDIWAMGACIQMLATTRKCCITIPVEFYSWDPKRQRKWRRTAPRVVHSLSNQSQDWYRADVVRAGYKDSHVYSKSLAWFTSRIMRWNPEERPTALQVLKVVDMGAGLGVLNDCETVPAWVYPSD
jgi:serine/threonine protein kinase